MVGTSKTMKRGTKTYVTAVDAHTKRGAKCVTVYGLTAPQILDILLRAVETKPRKAG